MKDLTRLVYTVHIPAVITMLVAMLNGVTAVSAREVRYTVVAI